MVGGKPGGVPILDALPLACRGAPTGQSGSCAATPKSPSNWICYVFATSAALIASSTSHPARALALAHHDFRNRLSVGNSGLPVGRKCRIGDSAAQEVSGFLEGAIILLVGRYVRLRARLFVAFRLQVAA